MYDPAKSTRPYKRVLTPRENPMAEVQEPRKKSATVIYRPEHGDPSEVLMFATENTPGILFKANEPVDVPYSRTIDQLLVEKFETPDGTKSKSIERKVPLPDVIRGNPSFEIDGIKPERIRPLARMPTDSDGYRGYAINWISVSMSADSMDKRWAGEEGLRQRCGCSPADIAYLRPFFEARRMETAELDRQRHVA